MCLSFKEHLLYFQFNIWLGSDTQVNIWVSLPSQILKDFIHRDMLMEYLGVMSPSVFSRDPCNYLIHR